MRRGSTSTSAGVTIFPLFLNDTAPTEIYTLPLHAALPISRSACLLGPGTTGITVTMGQEPWVPAARSEEHTSELQSHHDPVCRLLLETTNDWDGQLTSGRSSRRSRASSSRCALL